jgi:hypothetical protein
MCFILSNFGGFLSEWTSSIYIPCWVLLEGILIEKCFISA